MYCKECGKQNPRGAKFCSSCGSALEGTFENQSTTDWENSVDNQKHQVKKKSGGMKKWIITAVVFVVCFVCSYVATSWENSLPDVEPSSGAPSTAYSNIFWNYGPGTPESDFAGQGLKTASYVIHQGNNMLENMECVYEDGVVLAMVDSIYVPVYGLDDVARAELNTMMTTNLRTYTALSFCQLSSYEDNGFYVYKLIFTDLDKKENVHQLCATGLISIPAGESKVDQIGIKTTEDGLLAGGYVKR